MKDLGRYGALLQLGWVVAISILLPLGLGLWLDRRLSTSPLFILLGALVGILASTIGVVRMATRDMDNAAKRHSPPETGEEIDGKEDTA